MDEPIKVAAGILTVSVLVFAIDSAAPAQTPSNGLPPGASQIERHQPWSSRYIGVGGSDAFRRRDNGFSGNNSSGSFGGQRFNGRDTFIFG
jgi:hypothetical protein